MTNKQPADTAKGLPTGDRVWIELERFAGDDVCTRRAERASKMLEALGFRPKLIWWHPTKSRYCVTVDEAGGFLEMADNGHWFYFDQIDFLRRSSVRVVDDVHPAENIGSTTGQGDNAKPLNEIAGPF